MKTKKILFYVLAGILGGCVPVMSLHPLYTDKDLVFEEKLLGIWVDDPNDPETTWEFKDPNEQEKTYKLIFSDDEGQKGSFVARLVKLKNKLFLDVFPNQFPCEEEKQEHQLVEDKITLTVNVSPKWPYNTFFFVPFHSFIKVNGIEPQLKLQLTDDEEMGKLLKENPNAVEHTSIEDKPILTASTKELQAFVLKYADDDRVFTDEVALNRQKTKEPNEILVSEPNKAQEKSR